MNTHPSIEQLVEKIRHLPEDRVAEVEDFVDFLSERARRQATATPSESFDFPVIRVGQWPDDLSLNREEMYGDDGR